MGIELSSKVGSVTLILQLNEICEMRVGTEICLHIIDSGIKEKKNKQIQAGDRRKPQAKWSHVWVVPCVCVKCYIKHLLLAN